MLIFKQINVSMLAECASTSFILVRQKKTYYKPATKLGCEVLELDAV
jgi:hypothetical protein